MVRLQRIFVDNHVVLGAYPEEWIIERFFWETLGVSYESICEILVNSWVGPGALMLQEMESHLIAVRPPPNATRISLHRSRIRKSPKCILEYIIHYADQALGWFVIMFLLYNPKPIEHLSQATSRSASIFRHHCEVRFWVAWKRSTS